MKKYFRPLPIRPSDPKPFLETADERAKREVGMRELARRLNLQPEIKQFEAEFKQRYGTLPQ